MVATYLVVSFLQNAPWRFQEEDWPLHATIIRPFTLTQSLEDFKATMHVIAGETAPFTMTGMREELFGPYKDVPVVELCPSAEFTALREKIMRYAGSYMVSVGEQYATYRPHVTHQKCGRIQVGDSVRITHLSVVRLKLAKRVVHMRTPLTGSA